MKNNNVIEFPREKSLRIRFRDRSMQQRGVLVLSIFAVLAMTVVSNQWLTRIQEGNVGGRSLASVPGMLGASAENVKWEHALARELSRDTTRKAHLAVKPTLKDELLYGSLEGRYGLKMTNGRIESLEFIEAHSGHRPVLIQDRAAFLGRYAEAFSVSYASVGMVESSGGLETWNLLDADKTIVGKAQLKLDESGRLVSLTVE